MTALDPNTGDWLVPDPAENWVDNTFEAVITDRGPWTATISDKQAEDLRIDNIGAYGRFPRGTNGVIKLHETQPDKTQFSAYLGEWAGLPYDQALIRDNFYAVEIGIPGGAPVTGYVEYVRGDWDPLIALFPNANFVFNTETGRSGFFKDYALNLNTNGWGRGSQTHEVIAITDDFTWEVAQFAGVWHTTQDVDPDVTPPPEVIQMVPAWENPLVLGNITGLENRPTSGFIYPRRRPR